MKEVIVEMKEKMLINFLNKNGISNELKTDFFTYLMAVKDLLIKQSNQYTLLKESFDKSGSGVDFVPCPSCKSPVLIDYQKCPFCGEQLIDFNNSPIKSDNLLFDVSFFGPLKSLLQLDTYINSFNPKHFNFSDKETKITEKDFYIFDVVYATIMEIVKQDFITLKSGENFFKSCLFEIVTIKKVVTFLDHLSKGFQNRLETVTTEIEEMNKKVLDLKEHVKALHIFHKNIPEDLKHYGWVSHILKNKEKVLNDYDNGFRNVFDKCEIPNAFKYFKGHELDLIIKYFRLDDYNKKILDLNTSAKCVECEVIVDSIFSGKVLEVKEDTKPKKLKKKK